MAKNIFDKLSDWYNSYKKDRKEFRSVPRDFYLDLDSLEYQKYKDNIPKAYGFNSFVSIFISLVWIKMWIYGFLFYVICDFMNYLYLKELILNFSLIFSQINHGIFLIVMWLFIAEYFILFIEVKKRQKYHLKFYRRMKNKKIKLIMSKKKK